MKLPQKLQTSFHRTKYVTTLGIGLILGCAAIVLFLCHDPKGESAANQHDSGTLIFERIVKQDEIVFASQQYTFIEKAIDDNRLFDSFDSPTAQDELWYRYSGTIEAVANLNKAKMKAKNDATLCISLPQLQLRNTPNMDASAVLQETNRIFSTIHVSDIEAFKRDCISRSNKLVEEQGFIAEAKKGTQDALQRMFDIALGENRYKIEVNWLEDKEASPR